MIPYQDDLHFRAEHDDVMQDAENRYLLISKTEIYIPYDVLKQFHCYTVTVSGLFPKLHTSKLKSIFRNDSTYLNAKPST